MADNGNRNAIFFLRALVERKIEVHKYLHLCFMDYSKEFDKVKHSDLYGILLGNNCHGKNLKFIRKLYWKA